MRNRLGRLQIRLPWGIDWSLYAVPIILAFVGIIIIFSVSYATKPTLMITQIVSTAIGLGLAIAITFIDYRNFKGLSLILYLIVIVLLVLVLFVGGKSFGATRWINLGFYQLQPSEIGKLFIALFLARIFAETEEFNWKRVLFAFSIIIVPIALIMRQPDLGTALVIFVSLIALLFFSPIKKRLLAAIIAVMILAAPVGWHFLKPYQKERIYTFINPSSDPYESGYNVTQARITVGSGGLLGQGIGRGTQIQLNFLPCSLQLWRQWWF